MENTLQIAKTILQQLGGNRFIAMTGASNFGGSDVDQSLSFKVGRNDAGVTHVRIVLTPMDVYTMTFFKIRGTKCTTVATRQDVYCDDLQGVFETETGLRTRLF